MTPEQKFQLHFELKEIIQKAFTLPKETPEQSHLNQLNSNIAAAYVIDNLENLGLFHMAKFTIPKIQI